MYTCVCGSECIRGLCVVNVYVVWRVCIPSLQVQIVCVQR